MIDNINRAVSLININSKKELLFLLRDDSKEIPFPNHWDFVGGRVEKGEHPEAAMAREIKEELNLNLPDLKLMTVYKWVDKWEYIYLSRQNINIQKIHLSEGQEIKYATFNSIINQPLAFYTRTILTDLNKGKWPKS